MGVDGNLWTFRKGGTELPNSNKCEQGGTGVSKDWSFCDKVVSECPQWNFSTENLLKLQLWEFILKCGIYECIQTMIIRIYHYLPNKTNSSQKPFFLGMATLFILSLVFCRSRFLKKTSIVFGLISLYLFQIGRNNGVEI